ncbi:ABC transporter ATP-binding protein [Ramlibacter tataouinensis]|uniref:ABC transporter ATP-binding protein n=1 Tax=Ramlibacter tataouinensis TaxID=94132 RepID=UPI0022F3FADA|nr:ABC transporter ATP-binding protein [Ramlibacter tataouinensis]WBY00714.1 ABC transporter ATP-binding protein [Ramlibacter tataouinensis]
MPQLAVSVEGITKHFPKAGRLRVRELLTGLPPERRFTAIDGISLDVPKGEVVGVLGRNGAGKSTLLRLVGGIYSPDSGAIALNGHVAGLFEMGGFGNTQLTGREFANRYLQLFGVSRAQREAVVAEVREFAELGDYFDQLIRTYSAGMAARLYFATATAIPHEIYLIDEILSVGDEHFQAKSWARMRERLASGASGLLVTHDWSAVIRLCRESKVLERGRILLQGRSDRVVADYLQLPRPAADRARLAAAPGERLQASSGRACALDLELEILAPGPVELAVSIEALQLGTGWEPVILTEFQPVASSPGRYRATVRIEALPLRAGEYTLNVFLATPPDSSGVRETLDVRGWTYGNAMTLAVDGEPGGGIAPFAVRWTEVAR